MFHQGTLNGRAVHGVVKSLQRGTIALSAAQTSNTATIALVDPSNTLIFWGGNTGVSAAIDGDYTVLALTNSTTLTLSRLSVGDPGTSSGTYEVVEFWPGVIRNVQRGTFSLGSGSVTATITAVDVTRAQVIMTGGRSTAGASAPFGTISLQNATTVALTNGFNGLFGWQVWEWM